MKEYAFKVRTCRVIRRCLAAFVLVTGFAQAAVKLPNGEYRETVTDLRVKVLGGYVTVERTWLAENLNKGKYRWYVNPAWADLTFEYDGIDGSVKSIHRADSKFERAGNDVFVFERIYFIAKKDGGWRWYDRAGNWVLFLPDGRISSYGDRNGVTVHLERDGPDGKIGRVTDHHGALVLTLGYSADGARVETITDKAGRIVRYRYVGDELREVVDVAGFAWHYGYTNGLMTSKTDPQDHATAIAYSGNRVIKVTDAESNATTWDYAYDRGKRLYTIVEKSPHGLRAERRYDAQGRLVRELVGTRETYSLERDGSTAEASTNERGLVTRTSFDAAGNIVKTAYPDGTYHTAKYHALWALPVETVDRLGVRTLREYDAKGNLKILTEAAGTATERTTVYDYDALGQVERQTIKGRAETEGATTTWTHDTSGNVSTTTDPEAHAVSMTHDVMGNVLTLTDARGKRWTTAYDARGMIRSSKDPLQNETTYEYDAAGRRSRIIGPTGLATTWRYYADGRLKSIAAPGRTETVYSYADTGVADVVRADGSTATRYDADGRIESVTDGRGNAVRFVYGESGSDSAGLVVRRIFRSYCEDYGYDLAARRTSTTRRTPCEGAPQRLEKRTTGYDAAGRVVSETDYANRTTLSGYDELGRLVSVVDAGSNRTRLEYDARNNLVGVTDGNGAAYRMAYDRAGRLKAEFRPLGATKKFEYDDAGNLLVQTDPSGDRRTWSYDDAGRRTLERHYPAGANVATQTIEYRYDPRGLLERYVQSGDTVSSAVYDYDDAGSRTKETITYGGGSEAFSTAWSTSYWPSGRKKNVVYPGGFEAAYRYDDNGRILALDLAGSRQIAWSDYVGAVPGRVTMPGAIRAIAMDAVARAVQTTVSTGAGHALFELRETYDAAGNLMQRRTDGRDVDYRYDAQDRLVEASPDGDGEVPERYAYDGVHNRRSEESRPGAWTYNNDNQLLAAGLGPEQARYEYDADGNVEKVMSGEPPASTPALRNVYDAAGRLREVRREDVVVARYRYDPFGRRIRKETAQGVTWFQYSDDRLAAEFSADGRPVRLYGWDPARADAGRPLWLADQAADGWKLSFFHNSDIGAPLRITGEDGGVVWAARSRAFGKTMVDVASTTNPLRLPGQYFDVETGYHYNLNRYYEPETGRYLQADPLGIRAGVNLYAYARGNPLRFTDELGLSEWDVRTVLDQVLATFPDVHPREGVMCADFDEPKDGHTVSIFDGDFSYPDGTMQVDAKWCRMTCLSKYEWKSLFVTIFHETMHSTDPWWHPSPERPIYNRETYELDSRSAMPMPPAGWIWGKPLPRPGADWDGLYEQYQRLLGSCCRSDESIE